MKRLRVLSALGLAFAAVACKGGTTAHSTGTAPADLPEDTIPGAGEACARAAPSPAFERVSDALESGTVKLARMDGKTVAFVADEDGKAVFTVDVDKKTELAVTPLPAAPSHLILTADGRVIVALREGVVVLEPSLATAPLATRCAVPTAVEPVAMALTPGEKTLLVSSGWGAALGAFDARTLAKSFEVPLAREPRAVVVSEDGREAIVAHAVGAKMSRVTLDDPKHTVNEIDMRPRTMARTGADPGVDPKERRMSCQTFALAKSLEPGGRILAPGVAVDPGEVTERPSGYGNPNTPTEMPAVAVIPEGSYEPVATSVAFGTVTPSRNAGPECLLPRAATVDPSSKSLLVTCYGSNQLVALDAASPAPAIAVKHRWKVGAGPSGVDVDAHHSRAVVWAQFDRTLQVVSLAGVESPVDEKDKPNPVTKIALSKPAGLMITDEQRLGRQLFHAAGDPRISSDGRACASCHPDGRDDSIVWSTPDGPRRSVMLMGRVEGTAPYGWNGANKDLEEHITHTFERLTGSGLSGLELSSLIAYVSALKAPRPAADDTYKIATGDAVFHSGGTGCSTCHDGAALTDHKVHDVGSKTTTDKTAEFDTPSLKYVSKRGPYFHDGRYATLRDLLKGSDVTMGHTSQLSAAELDGLEAYLRSL